MSSNALYRLAGIALLIGGLAAAIGFGLPPYTESVASLQDPMTYITSTAICLGSMLILLGLPAVLLRQNSKGGVLGFIGFLCVAYVILLTGVIQSFITVTVVNAMAQDPKTAAFGLTPPPNFTPFFSVVMLAVIIGPITLGIATLRAKAFPSWVAWLFFLVVVAGLAQFLPFYPVYLQNVAPVLANLAVAGFGIGLLMPQRAAMAQDVVARVGAAA